MPVAELCREQGMSSALFYRWWPKGRIDTDCFDRGVQPLIEPLSGLAAISRDDRAWRLRTERRASASAGTIITAPGVAILDRTGQVVDDNVVAVGRVGCNGKAESSVASDDVFADEAALEKKDVVTARLAIADDDVANQSGSISRNAIGAIFSNAIIFNDGTGARQDSDTAVALYSIAPEHGVEVDRNPCCSIPLGVDVRHC